MVRKLFLAWSVLLVALTTLSVADDKKEPQKKETLEGFVKKLQGTWKVDSAELNGRNDAQADRKGFLIEDNVYTFIFDGKARNTAKLVIDVSKEPATVDLKWTKGANAGQTSLGIIRLKDDKVEICYNQSQGAGSNKRPTKFTTKATAGSGAGSVLWILTKGDDEKEPEKKGPVKKGPGDKEALKNFVKKLQGKWKVDSSEFGGNEDAQADRKGFLIEDNVYTFIFDGKARNTAKLVIDVSKEPATVDLKWTKGANAGQTSLGIIRLKDDKVEICYNQSQGAGSNKRPTKFTTKATAGSGAGSVLWILTKDE